MIRFLVLALAFILAGCVTFPLPQDSKEGRLVVASKLVRNHPSGPWWDYQIWARHDVTGEKVIINIKVNNSKTIHLSKSLPVGNYTIYEWNSVSKNSAKAYDHDIQGNFEIKAKTLTLFDHQLTVTTDEHSQSFNFSQKGATFKNEFTETLKNSHENVENWDLYWSWTPKVSF